MTQTRKLLSEADKGGRPRLLAPTLFAFLCAAAVAGLIVAFVEHLHVGKEKVTASNIGQTYVRIVSQSVSQALSSTYALAALVRQGGGAMRDFGATASQMLQLYPGVGALELAPDGIVRDIVPLAGNEGAVGHHLLQDPARTKEAFLARDTGKLTLAGPFDLIQGGVAAAGRLPVFLPDPSGGQKFWGFAIALLRFPDVLNAAGLPNLRKDGYHYELWRTHPDTGKKQVFGASGSAPLVDPVEHSFGVPNGAWTLSVAPIAGWHEPAALWPRIAAGLLGSLLFALLVRHLLRRPLVLREEVALRTAELAARNSQLETIINVSPAAMVIVGLADGVYLKVNPAYARLIGFAKEELIGHTAAELGILDPEERARLVASVRELGSVRNLDLLLHRKDGTPVQTYISSVPFPFEGRECLLHMLVDVSDKKVVEQELALREQQLRVIFDTSQAGIILVNPQGVITFANERMALMFGCPLKELIGSRYPEHLHPDERLVGDERMRRLIAGELTHVHSERHYLRADGSDFWGYLSGRRHEAADGSLISLVGVIVDITERRRAEDRLRESEERYRTVVEQTDDLITRVDAAGRLLFVNSASARFWGLLPGECIGRSAFEFVHPDDRDTTMRAFGRWLGNGSDRMIFENRQISVTGQSTETLWTITALRADDGTVVEFTSIARDMTERKRLEGELIRGQKLESLGTLAGGIAHDFNNILTGILGNVSFAHALVGVDHPAAPRLEQCEKAAVRAGELTRQLLTFARGGEPVRRSVDAKRLAEESLSFALRGANVRGALDCPPDLWPFDADPGQISQVFNNLLINAKQAMPEGGTVTVRAENLAVHEGDPFPVRPGRYVKVAVADQGTGIAPGDLPRIFDPYFTTKPTGTGLGLASVYSIIKRHGGTVTASSEPGRGSTFTLLIPAAKEQASEGEADSEAIFSSRGAEEILVMDDEEMIRNLGVAMLGKLGYLVTACSDGREAVALHAAALERGRPFAALILDLTVPGGMGGREAAALIRKLDPKVPLVVSSGYSNDAVVAAYREHGFSGAVAKPYTLRAMASELARVIEERDKGCEPGPAAKA